MPRKLLYLLPLLVFAFLLMFFMQQIGEDSTKIPTVLTGRQLPAFKLAVLGEDNEYLTEKSLVGRPILLNVWASWCLACRAEVKVLQQIADSGEIAVIGLDYKDQPALAISWLEKYGNPYQLSLQDMSGQYSIELGVYGVPETYLLDAHGVIIDKWIGELTWDAWQQHLRPKVLV